MTATEMVHARPQALATGGGMDREQLELLKRTICEDATDDEYLMFVGICKRTGLDPFAKQIYFRKYKARDGKPPRVTVITGIDGYRLMAQRTGEYEGQTEPEWCGPDGAWKKVWLENKAPAAARVGVWRTRFREPSYAIAKWSEYYPSHPNERFMWDKMPANQIAKCAEALALRKAFPHELSGLYIREEMAQAEASAGTAGGNTTRHDGSVQAGSLAPSTSAPTTKPPRANTVKHDGTFASHKQVTLLHVLKSKVGGLVSCSKQPCYADDDERTQVAKMLCAYHKQLAAFKDCDGRPIKTSTDLSEAQISNLIDRYEAKIKQQETRASEPPDLDAAFNQAEENAHLRGMIEEPGAEG